MSDGGTNGMIEGTETDRPQDSNEDGSEERTVNAGTGGLEARPGQVTARDRELLALLSMARYLTTAQANALVRPGRDESVGRRRLFTLAGLAPRARGRARRAPPVLFAPPYVRRLVFRRTTGERVDLWALTRRGEALAAEVLGREFRVERRDVSEPFREHWAVLTDLLVGLAAPLLARGVRARALPFQWDPSEATDLPWREYDAEAGKVRERLMVPDAVLALPGARRRYLVECEMGTHSIVAASDEKAGATLHKVERYDEFFAGFEDSASRVTFYEKAFPDGWPAEVLFLVRTDGRRERVNAALAHWRAGRGKCAVSARAVTMDDALRELGVAVGAAPPAALSSPPAEGVARLAPDDFDALRRFYQEALRALGSAGQPLPEALRATALRARAVLSREGQPPASATGGEGR